MSEPFIAHAQVVIAPNTKGFRTKMVSELKGIKEYEHKVKVVPNTKGFAAEVNRQLKALKYTPVKVKIIPDPTGFRAAALLAATQATKGLVIPMGAVPKGAKGGAGAAGVPAGGVVDKRAATAQLAVTAAIDAGVAARRRDIVATDEHAARQARLTRELLSLKLAQEAVTRAITSGIGPLITQAETLERTATAAVAKTTGVISRNDPAAISARELKANDDLLSAKRVTAAQFDAIEADRIKAHANSSDQIDAFYKQEASSAEAAAAKVKKSSADEIKAFNTRERLGVEAAARVKKDARDASVAQQISRSGRDKLGGLVPGRKELLDINDDVTRSLERSTEATTLGARAERQAAVALKSTGNITKQLQITRSAAATATTAVVVAEEALAAAHASAIPEVIALRNAELSLAETRAATLTTAAASLERTAVGASRLSAGKRAIQTIGASLAGLRGAALSAEGAFLAAAAGAIALTKAVSSAADLESELNTFKIVAGATADEMDRVGAEARKLGADVTLPSVGARDAAEAFSQLARAGLSVQDSLDGARGVLQLSTAAQITNAEATELAASALNAFGLAGDQAVRVADVLTNAANDSQGSIVDIGVALQQASAVARQAGLTLEQTVSALTLFARAGLKGSDAGTSLRTALIRLINPTAKAQRVIDQLGLRLRTSTGAIDITVFDQFTQATKGMTKAQRDQNLAIIFGQDAIRGAAILARTGATGFDAQTDSLRKQGSAAELANARMAGLAGSLENLKNQIATTGLVIGSVLIPPLKITTDALAGMFETVNNVAAAIDVLIDKFKDAVGPINAAADAVKKFPEKIPGSDFVGGLFDKLPDIPDLPIPTVLDVIPDSPKDLFLNFIPGRRQFKTINDFADRVRGMFEVKGDATEVGLEVQRILKNLNDVRTGSDGIRFTSAIGDLEKMRARLAGGDEEAQRLSGHVADVIADLKQGQVLPPFRFPQVELPPELASETAKIVKQIDTVNKAQERQIVVHRRAIAVNTKKGAILIPTVFDGRALKGSAEQIERQALRHFRQTGEHLGAFASVATAEAYAANLRRQSPLIQVAFDNALVNPAGKAGREAGMSVTSAFDNAASVEVWEGFGFNVMGGFSVGIAKGALAAAGTIAEVIPFLLQQADNIVQAGIRNIISTAERRAGRLEERGLDLEAAGAGPAARIALEREKIRDAEREIKGLEGKKSDPAIKARREAKQRRNAALDEIERIEEEAKTEAEQKKNDIKSAADKADQAFLDAIAPPIRKLDTAAIVAQGTEDLRDDNIVLKARKKALNTQIKQIDASLKDRKEAAALIADKRDEIIKIDQTIEANNKAILESGVSKGEEAFEAQVSLAEAEGNIPLQIKLTKLRIKKINERIAAGKLEGAAINRLKTQRAEARNKLEELQNEQISSQIALGESILELTGKKNPLLRALDKAIAETRADVKRAKDAGKSTTILQTELNNFLAKRKEVLEEAKEDADKGTTAFELLASAAETFRATGGNLISGNQPFAGPAGFTADISQFLQRKQTKGAATFTLPGKAADDHLVSVNTQLVKAVVDLTQVMRDGPTPGKRGNVSTAADPRRPSGESGRANPEATWSRQRREGGV